MDTQKQENGTEDMRYGRWLWFTVGAVLAMLVMLGGLVVWVDPFFHYHMPLEHLAYPIDSERYQNDGISRNFTYDAVLTGTSMKENFKASRFDSLFGVSSVKIPYAGGYYKEVDQAVRRALSYNPQVKVVCRSLDRSFLFYQKDQQNPAAPSPDYLTDDNPFNDVNYIFNKEVIFGTCLLYTSKAHQLYYESAAVVVTLVMLGKFMESRSKGKTSEAIRKLMELAPDTAILYENGMEREVETSLVSVGQHILIKPGSRIPLDGILIQGSSSVDESMLTGESIPVEKQPGDSVIGGSMNYNGAMEVEVTHVGSDTTLSKIIKMIEDAQGKKAPISKLADKDVYKRQFLKRRLDSL